MRATLDDCGIPGDHIPMDGPASLVVVTGRPATGKSALAAELRRREGWPVLEKDTIKEALVETLGADDPAASRRLSDASFRVLFALARAWPVGEGGALVLEGNFRPGEHEPALGEILRRRASRLVQVVLHAPRDALVERLRARASAPGRHPGHRDLDVAAALLGEETTGGPQPLALPGTLLVEDTSSLDARRLEAIAAAVVAAAAHRPWLV
jgi:glucokinase